MGLWRVEFRARFIEAPTPLETHEASDIERIGLFKVPRRWECRVVRRFGVTLALLLSLAHAFAGSVEDYAAKLAPLIDPAKLATLRVRGANPRVQKAVYWLSKGREDKAEPAKVVDAALRTVGMKDKAAELTKATLLRNLKIAEELGCLDEEGLDEMRKGNAATVKRGPYAGDQLSVDHIIPRSVCPELDCVIANLELMPERMNTGKGAKVGQRQHDLARKLNGAGLLSDAGMKAVLRRR